jgi:hypothetical protein
MGVELLVYAKDNIDPNAEIDERFSAKKGDIVVIKEQPAVWGSQEGPPDWIQLVITDATRAQALQYLRSWERTIAFTVNSFVVDPIYIGNRIYNITISATEGVSVSGKGAITKPKVEQWVVNHGGNVESFGPNFVTVTVSVGMQPTYAEHLSALREYCLEELETKVKNKRYYFAAADVDAAIAAGGRVSYTRAQVIPKLQDRIAE